MSIHYTTFDFIRLAKKLHGDKYSYEKVNYKTSHEKIEIKCEVHGFFWQTANDHLDGHGCPKCGGVSEKTTLEVFINRSLKQHGHKYDYSKVEYSSIRNKVIIICPTHGDFFQRPYSHWRGSGCPKCRYQKNNCKRIKTTEQFIKEAKLVHVNMYDYSKTKYYKATEKLSVFCKKHGEFRQTPINHVKNKQGCPKCRLSLGERKILQWLEEKNIKYITQKMFKGCINPDTKYPLRYDFFLPNFNILIEYDGEQHFRTSLFWTHHKTEKELMNMQLRDKIKNIYAKNNGLDLLRISFREYNKIDEILKGKLNV